MFYFIKVRVKSIIIISLILLLAVISTYYIYHNFQDERKFDYDSDSLNIVFNEQDKNQIAITKITPVTDSVGLSSKAYSFTITNNLTEQVNYNILILDDLDKELEDNCSEYKIPKEDIRIAIKEDKKEPNIYTLSTLEEHILLKTSITPLAQKKYSITVWIDKDTTLTSNSLLHYHGKIEVEEDNVLGSE